MESSTGISFHFSNTSKIQCPLEKVFFENAECHKFNDNSHRNFTDRDIISSPQLHLTNLIIKQKWKKVIESLTFEKFLQETTNHLHLACSMPDVPTYVIHAIIKQYPDACLTEDEDGSLPIHVACSTPGMNLQVIQNLMVASPKSCLIRENNARGGLPMYLLIETNGSTNVEYFVSFLISNLPTSCIYDEMTSLISDVSDKLLPEAIIHKILQIHPQVCRIQHRNGDTLLHIMCSHSDVALENIQTIVNLYPDLCAIQDNEGNLPLHMVNSRSQSEEIIQILLHTYPHGLSTTNVLGQIPLCAPFIRKSSIRVKAMLSYTDDFFLRHILCTKDKYGLIPIQEFYYEMQCNMTQYIMTSSHTDSLQCLNLEYYPALEDHIKSLYYLITAFTYGSIGEVESTRNFTVSHQSHQLYFWTAFPLLTKLMLTHFPFLVKEQDCNGAFPLHIIAKEIINTSDVNRCFTCGNFPTTGTFLRFNGRLQLQTCLKCSKNTDLCHKISNAVGLPLTDYQNDEVIKDVLYMYPEAASVPDPFGDLPLHLSLRAGRTWEAGVKEIFDAAPDAIHVQDRLSRQFPFMIAASKRFKNGSYYAKELGLNRREIESNRQRDLSELTTVFELLRRHPCAVDLN